jgi:ubiquinone/menaquinone biosynthesis C-methylase UbiE
VLEIGFGPGIAIDQAARIATGGFVAGIDHSAVMVRQASRRNAEAIQRGRVALQLGTASAPPAFAEPFDKIFTINSIHFWTDPVECLRKLRKLLKAGGRIAITIQPRSRNATDATTTVIGEEIARKLEEAGFSDCRIEIKNLAPRAVACVLATSPHRTASGRSQS